MTAKIAKARLLRILSLDRVLRHTRQPTLQDCSRALLEYLEPVLLLDKFPKVYPMQLQGTVIKWRKVVPFNV